MRKAYIALVLSLIFFLCSLYLATFNIPHRFIESIKTKTPTLFTLPYTTTPQNIEPTSTPVVITPTQDLQKSSVKYYTVQAGDTLTAIADQFGVSYLELASINNITNPSQILPGQVIKITTDKDSETIDPYYISQISEITGNEKHILIDLSEQTLYTYEGDKRIGEYLISSGLYPHLTVTGEFKVWIKLESTLMTGEGYYLPNVPYTMYFYGDYGIHGTYWHNNFGHPMSHGCINMRTEDAKIVFEWAKVGTIVQVIE